MIEAIEWLCIILTKNINTNRLQNGRNPTLIIDHKIMVKGLAEYIDKSHNQISLGEFELWPCDS